MCSTNRIIPTNPWSHLISAIPKQQPLQQLNAVFFNPLEIELIYIYTYKI